jgi:PAS domain S-box-containing protein
VDAVAENGASGAVIMTRQAEGEVKKARIMIVEDEVITAMYVEEILNGLDYDVVGTVATGEEAVELARKTAPDLVLMDIQLQGEMDGVEAAENIRAQGDSAVVYLTAGADAGILDRAKATEPFGYILKPFEERDLHSNIEMALYRREMERKLHISREQERKVSLRNIQLVEQLTSLLESLGEGVYGVDAKGVTTFVNPAMERITGFAARELIGKDAHELLHHTRADGSVYPPQECPIYSTARDGILRKVDDDVFWTKDGETFPVDYTVSSLRDTQGEPVGAVVVVRDITERKRIEAELKRHQESLEQLVEARTKELESFSYSVSHDLRAPLRAINGFSQALFEDYYDSLDGEARHYLERIRNSTERMSQLIEGLLTLSRVIRRELEYEPIDLSEIAWEVARGLQEADPTRSVRFEIQEGLTSTGDSTLIRLLLENLIGNAWKFTGKQKEGVVEFGRADAQDGEVSFYVRDNGVGFDAQKAGALFKPFQRLHSADDYEGTGIGLATVQRIVERHGGRCWAESEGVRGATFYFTLR